MKEAGGQPPTSNRRDVGLGLATLAFGSGLPPYRHPAVDPLVILNPKMSASSPSKEHAVDGFRRGSPRPHRDIDIQGAAGAKVAGIMG
jgi:hypothetical protein